jgi:hypothetical protein
MKSFCTGQKQIFLFQLSLTELLPFCFTFYWWWKWDIYIYNIVSDQENLQHRYWKTDSAHVQYFSKFLYSYCYCLTVYLALFLRLSHAKGNSTPALTCRGGEKQTNWWKHTGIRKRKTALNSTTTNKACVVTYIANINRSIINFHFFFCRHIQWTGCKQIFHTEIRRHIMTDDTVSNNRWNTVTQTVQCELQSLWGKS